MSTPSAPVPEPVVPGSDAASSDVTPDATPDVNPDATPDAAAEDVQATEDTEAIPDDAVHDANGFSWLLIDFARRVPDVEHVLAVSADGLLMAASADLDRTQGDTVAAIVAGLTSLVRGASNHLGGGEVRQAVVEMDALFLLTMSISEGAVLAVVADAGCDVGLVGYEMALLVARAEDAMTPQLIEDARALLPVEGSSASTLAAAQGAS